MSTEMLKMAGRGMSKLVIAAKKNQKKGIKKR